MTDIPSNLVAKLRAEVVVPYKDGYEPMRAPPSKLMTDAADEIERLTSDFQQVHHNCIHARSVADKALELLSSVRLDQMASEWNCALVEVRALARSVPPVETGCDPRHLLREVRAIRFGTFSAEHAADVAKWQDLRARIDAALKSLDARKEAPPFTPELHHALWVAGLRPEGVSHAAYQSACVVLAADVQRLRGIFAKAEAAIRAVKTGCSE